MNVSFGRFIYNEEIGARKNPKQVARINYVGDIVDNPYTENELAQKIEMKKGADLCMDVNKNGTVDLYVNKEMLARQEYIPFDKDGETKLQARIKLNSSLSNIKKQVEAFLKKCNEYAEEPNCAKNEKIEEINQDEALKDGSSLRAKSELKDIEEYEDFLCNSGYKD